MNQPCINDDICGIVAQPDEETDERVRLQQEVGKRGSAEATSRR